MVKGDEGLPTLQDTGPYAFNINNRKQTDEARKLLGVKNMAKVLAVRIDKDVFDKSQMENDRFLNSGDYRLFLNDCTTFIFHVADSIGLYTPPRIFTPFPSMAVTAFGEQNRSDQLKVEAKLADARQ